MFCEFYHNLKIFFKKTFHWSHTPTISFQSSFLSSFYSLFFLALKTTYSFRWILSTRTFDSCFSSSFPGDPTRHQGPSGLHKHLRESTHWTSQPHPGSVLLKVHVRAQPCPTLLDSLDCSPPGFSVHGILQAKILEWVTISSFRGSSRFRNQTTIFCVSCISASSLLAEPSGKPPSSKANVQKSKVTRILAYEGIGRNAGLTSVPPNSWAQETGGGPLALGCPLMYIKTHPCWWHEILKPGLIYNNSNNHRSFLFCSQDESVCNSLYSRNLYFPEYITMACEFYCYYRHCYSYFDPCYYFYWVAFFFSFQ